MPEKDQLFSSKIKYNGIFSFADFYKFCYQWLTEEIGLGMGESKYAEKISGDSKNIDILWEGDMKMSDYFKFAIKVKFQILGLKKVEINQAGQKVETNKGSVEVAVKGILIRDYEGKFETNATQKFWRSVYEKWIIPSRIEQFEDKVIANCDEFLSQAKAFLDLEGKK